MASDAKQEVVRTWDSLSQMLISFLSFSSLFLSTYYSAHDPDLADLGRLDQKSPDSGHFLVKLEHHEDHREKFNILPSNVRYVNVTPQT